MHALNMEMCTKPSNSAQNHKGSAQCCVTEYKAMQQYTMSCNNTKGKGYAHYMLLLLFWAAYQHLTPQLHSHCLKRRQLAAHQVATSLLHCVTTLLFITPSTMVQVRCKAIVVAVNHNSAKRMADVTQQASALQAAHYGVVRSVIACVCCTLWGGMQC